MLAPVLVAALILAAPFAPLWAQGDEQGLTQSCPGRGIDGVATIYLPSPVPQDATPYTRETHHLRFRSDGSFTFDGAVTNFEKLPGQLQRVSARPQAWIMLHPMAGTPFAKVVKAVAQINQLKLCNHLVIGTQAWAYSQAFSRSDAEASGLSAQPVPPFPRPNQAVVTLDFGPTLAKSGARGKGGRQTCRMLFNDTPADIDEGYSRSFRTLDHYVKTAGGPAVVISEIGAKGLPATPTTVIQAKAHLPWHCAATALDNAQRAGYPVADLVVLGN